MSTTFAPPSPVQPSSVARRVGAAAALTVLAVNLLASVVFSWAMDPVFALERRSGAALALVLHSLESMALIRPWQWPFGPFEYLAYAGGLAVLLLVVFAAGARSVRNAAAGRPGLGFAVTWFGVVLGAVLAAVVGFAVLWFKYFPRRSGIHYDGPDSELHVLALLPQAVLWGALWGLALGWIPALMARGVARRSGPAAVPGSLP